MGSFRSHWEVKEFFDISGHRAGLSIFKEGEVVHHVTGGSAGLDHFPLNGTSGVDSILVDGRVNGCGS